LSKKTSAVIYR